MKISLGTKHIWVNYHHLYCFFVIAQIGSMSKASRQLGIGPSALSIQIRQLEQQLGSPLFRRAHRQLYLTEQGKLVLSFAKEIFHLGLEMVQALHDRPTEATIHLQIGALDTIPKHLTVALIEHARRARPCQISVFEGKTNQLLHELKEHRMDLILTNDFPSGQPGELYARTIARLPLWVVGAKKFTKLQSQFPQSLDQQPFIVPTSDSRVRHEIDHYCKTHGIQPTYDVETQDVMVQKLLALKGVGLTVLPAFAIQEYLDRKELYTIGKLDERCEEIFLLSSIRHIENPVAAHLMKHFKVRGQK